MQAADTHTSNPPTLVSSTAAPVESGCTGGTTSQTAAAASIASVLTKSLLHPLDTLKCRFQVHVSARGSAGTTSPPLPPTSTRVGSVWREVRHSYRGRWGPQYLYGGLPVKLFFYVPYQTVYLTSYNLARDALVRRTMVAAEARDARPLSSSMDSEGGASAPAHAASSMALLWCTIAAATVAELSSCLVRVPMETIKMRIQSTAAAGTGDALRQLRRNGFMACARLAIPQTLMHDVPYSVLQWITYEALRPRWESVLASPPAGTVEGSATLAGSGRGGDGAVGFLHTYRSELVRTLLSGGLSGLLAATLTLPLDNIRTRVVVATARNPSLRVRDVVASAYQADGLASFCRGGSMRVLWVTANMACYFPLFELCRAALVRRTAHAQGLPGGGEAVEGWVGRDGSGRAAPQSSAQTTGVVVVS